MDETKFKELKRYFMKEKDIEFALIFGSVARGESNALSDIDIGVYLKDGKDTLKLAERQIEITCAIMRLYKSNQVDIVVLNLANPFLRFQAIKYGCLIYAKDPKVFYEFKAISLGIYQDIRPMYNLYEKTAEIGLRRR